MSDRIEAKESQVAGARDASESYQVTPCIVIGAGDAVWDRFEDLRASVESWLGESFPTAGVRWGKVRNTEEVTPEWANRLIDPLLDFKLWLYLCELGYTTQLPSPEALAPLRAYILYDPGDEDVVPDLMKVIAKQLTASVSGRACLRQTLILLVPNNAVRGDIPHDLFDEIYFIGRIGRGGLGVTAEHVYHVARIALHALVASEAGEIANTLSSAQDSCHRLPMMGLGASAVTTAVSDMRNYRTSRIVHVLLQPYVGELDSDTQNQLRDLGGKWMLSENSDWQATALRVLLKHGWRKNDKGQVLATLEPLQGSPLAVAIDTLSPDFVDQLTAHLVMLERTAREEFAKEGRRRLLAAMEQGGAIATERSQESAVDMEQEDSLSAILESAEDAEKGGGCLGRELYWLEGVLKATPERTVLARDADNVMEVYAPDEDGWRKHVEGIFFEARLGQLRLLRLRRETASPGQIFVRAFLAWPILATLMEAFLQYRGWMVWLGALAIVVIVVAASIQIWHTRLAAIDERLRGERLKSVRNLVLGVLAHYAKLENGMIVQSLTDIWREVSTLRDALTQQFGLHEQQVSYIMARAKSVIQQGPFIEYYLYDMQCCDEWIKQIVETEVFGRGRTRAGVTETVPARAIRVQVSDIIKRVIHNRIFGVVAAQMIQVIAADLGAMELNSRRLSAIELCDQVRELKGGDRWGWLSRRSLPMAGAGLVGRDFTIVALGDRADLAGADGRTSMQWEPRWQEARSRQSHRITFLSVVALPDDYLNQRGHQKAD